MLRELIDIAELEDFASGLSTAFGARAMVFDAHGDLLAATPARSAFCHLSRWAPASLPSNLHWTALPGGAPARIALASHAGVSFVVAPVLHHEQIDGFVALGEFRDSASRAPAPPANLPDAERRRWLDAWEALPAFQRSGDARVVATVRWAARMLANWRRQETHLNTAAEELALVGDIGELLAGERNLPTMLSRIVQETARAMKCTSGSLRLYNPETDELTIAASHRVSEDYLKKGAIRRKENPIDDEALTGAVVYIEDAATDPRIRFPVESRRAGIVSGLTAGMMYHGQPVGVLRVYTDHRRRFRASHRNLLRAVASQAAVAIVNARMAEERLKADALERQLALAGDLQARLVGGPRPTHPRVETAILYEPSSHVGGDFCDMLLLSDGRFAAVVGDVVGHGIAASLLMASVRGALRAIAETHADLSQILTRLNRHLCRESLGTAFVTLLMVALDETGERLAYCNAGHDPPYIRRDGQVLRPSDAGMVLGVNPDEQYPQGALPLNTWDFVLLFTDGVVEAMDFEGRLYGRERLRDALLTCDGPTAEETLRNIRWDIRRFVGLAEQSDDLTMLGLRVR